MTQSTSPNSVLFVMGTALLACQIFGGGTERGLLVDQILQVLIIGSSAYVILSSDIAALGRWSWAVRSDCASGVYSDRALAMRLDARYAT